MVAAAQILNPSTQETESGRSVICEFQASLFYANDLQASLLQKRGGGGGRKKTHKATCSPLRKMNNAIAVTCCSKQAHGGHQHLAGPSPRPWSSSGSHQLPTPPVTGRSCGCGAGPSPGKRTNGQKRTCVQNTTASSSACGSSHL